jgi:hypothetical protein
MRFTITFLGSVALMAFAMIAGGCGSDNNPLGSMGGQIFGDVASKQAGNMMTGNAQKQAEQQQAAAAQQAALQQQSAQQQAAVYKSPAMDMTGTLTEKKAADGAAAGWSFTEAGSTISMPVNVSAAVEKDARKLAGKTVILTGHHDTLGTGAFVAERVSVAAQ